jgi:hypothetical protein
MSSVTFSTTVGGDGSTVTDDDNATTGLGNGGALIRLVPMMQQVVNVASYVVSVGGAASNDAIAAAASASAASSSATAAAASYDSFDDRYLGAKSSNPTVDNDGNALLTGALYWNTTSSEMRVYSGSAWITSYLPASAYLALAGGTMTGAITFAAGQSFTGTLPLAGGTMTGAITFSAGQTVDGTNGIGYINIPQNSQSAAYTLVAADAGKHIFHPSTDANARTFTIPANGSVAYPIGTAISFVNMTSQVVSIAITTDTMYLAGTGTTGTRSLAQYGTATALKMTSTTWIISGAGLT